MLNVYDILINFQDSDRVYEFFEWNEADEIEHLKKIPLIKINSMFLDKVLKYKITIDKEFLEKIYKKTEVYNNYKTATIEYACLFTDGYKVVGIEFDKDGNSLFKSSLLLDEEDEVLDLSNKLKITNIKYSKVNKKVKETFLTREEEYRKMFLLKELKQAKKMANYDKINYLYREVFLTNGKDKEEKYNMLIKDINENYRDCYNKLFNILEMVHSMKKTTN